MKKQNELLQKMTSEGCCKEEIENALQIRFGQEAMKSSTIYQKMRLVRCNVDITKEREYHSERIDEQLVIAIQNILNEFPFSSVRSISHDLHVPSTTIYEYLTRILKLKYRITRWLPHELNDIQMANRVIKSNELFEVLEKSKHHAYRNIITGDQSWFLYQYHPKGKWCIESEERPEFEDDQTCHQKIMLTIIWGVWGFYIVDYLIPGNSYNSSYFKENIFDPLVEKKGEIWPNSSGKKIWLHLDNCRVHNSKLMTQEIEQSPFKRAPHPPYSPDLAPSDFYLFGKIKKQLEGLKFNSKEELFEKLIEILNKITKDERYSVFEEWRKRCDFVRKNNGIYYKK